jgi:hypothetical protein
MVIRNGDPQSPLRLDNVVVVGRIKILRYGFLGIKKHPDLGLFSWWSRLIANPNDSFNVVEWFMAGKCWIESLERIFLLA